LALNAGGKTKARLSGHRAECISATFHPLGNVLVSGSMDTNVKIWDLRNKSCVRTLSGHTDGVGSVEYSPDGRWVASASKDGSVKLWDLQAGKLLHDFVSNTAEISSVKFHPEEFWLATGSVDGVVRYWDLETFKLVGATPTDRGSSVRHISFFCDDGEQQLVSAADDGLRIWSWQPSRCVGYEPAKWDQVMDAHLSQDKVGAQQLVLCSKKDSMVSIWAVNMSQEKTGSPKIAESKREEKQVERSVSDLEDSYEADFFPEDDDENSSPENTQVVPPLKLLETKEEEKGLDEIRNPVFEAKLAEESKVGHNKTAAKVKVAKRQHLVSCNSRESPLGLSISEFMPKSLTISSKLVRSATKLSVAEEILFGHDKFNTVVRERLAEVDHAVSLWSSGDTCIAIEYVSRLNIESVTYDFLRIINLKNGQPPATLEICYASLPILAVLLEGVFENHIKLSLATCKYLLDSFHDIIVSTIVHERKNSARGSVDISREERITKCRQCCQGFQTVSTALSKLISSSSADMVARTRKESEFLSARLTKMFASLEN